MIRANSLSLPFGFPFLNEQAIAVVAIDLTSVGNTTGLREFLELRLVTESGQREIFLALAKVLSVLIPGRFGKRTGTDKARNQLPEAADALPVDGVEQVYVVANWPDVMRLLSGRHWLAKHPLGESLFLVIPGLTKENIEKLRALMPEICQDKPAAWACREIDSYAVIADPRMLDWLGEQRVAPRPEFTEALAAAGPSPVRIAVAVPPLFARAAREILQRPAPGTDEPLGEYLADIRWLAAGANPAADTSQLRLMVKLAPGGDYGRMLEFIGRTSPALNELLTFAKNGSSAPILPPATFTGDQILWTFEEPLKPLMARLIKQRAAAADARRLRQIGNALQIHHELYKEFPDVAIRDTDDKPLLSWRVAILPYLDQRLYEQFHLNEPWDSDHNRTLIEEMPDVFLSALAEPGHTRFIAPVGESLAFTAQKGGLKLISFMDGTSKTIMVVQANADHTVVWTKPEDLVVDLENPKRGITDGHTGFLAVFADGSVRNLKGSIKPESLRALLTRNGGELIDFRNL